MRTRRRTKASKYQVYKRLYKKAQKRLAKRGVKMADDKMLSYREYKEYYRDEMQKAKELKKEGKTYSKNINRDIVASQTYSKSYKYAKQLKQAMDRYYEDQYGGEIPKEKHITIRSILEKKFNFDELDDEYWYLRDQGLTAKEAAEEIAGLYFGS